MVIESLLILYLVEPKLAIEEPEYKVLNIVKSRTIRGSIEDESIIGRKRKAFTNLNS